MNRDLALISQRLAIGFLFFAILPAEATAASFTDVPSSRPDYQAIEYLKGQGILRGYDDGTFHPDKVINRAEVVKIITAPLLSGAALATASSPFSDVPNDAWFLQSVERARILGIIAGPPEKTTFRPTDPVLKAEFLKIFFKTKNIDTSAAFSDLPNAVSTDVQTTDWFFPYIRYAIASSMIMVNVNGQLEPGTTLTRGNVASLIYRYMMYEQGRRTQALLSEAESEVMNLLQMIDQKQMGHAELASARSLIAARGALQKNTANEVKGAVKITEGFQLITQAYRSGTENRLDDAITNAKKAWNTAEKAKEFSPSLEPLSTQMQSIAESIANDARTLKESH